jgi:hypothetical protein
MQHETTHTGFLADAAAIEAELIARQNTEFAEQMRIINQHDSTHCRLCGLVTAGSTIGGCHVQACDSCLVEWVQEQIGVKLS